MESRERVFSAVISLTHGMDHFLRRSFPPLVPIWGVAFGFPLWKIGMVLGALELGSAVGQAPMGHVSDRYDRRFVLPAGIGLMGGGVVTFVGLSSLDVPTYGIDLAGTTVDLQFASMLLAMAAVGLGSSTLHPTGYPLITENVSEDAKGSALGLWGAARAFGDGTAPLVIGVALLAFAWEPVVVAIGAVSLCYAVVLFGALGRFETRPPEQTTEDESGGESTAVRSDRRTYLYPMLAVFAMFALLIGASTGALVFIPEYITTRYGYTFTLAGFTVTPSSTASFYFSALLLVAGFVQLGVGKLVDRYAHRRLLLVFLAVAASALLTFGVVSLSPVGLLVVLVVLGASLWGLPPIRDSLISDISPADREGRTFGYLWTGAKAMSALVPPAVGYLGDVAGLRAAFVLLAGMVFCSMLPIALLRSNRVYVETPADVDVGSD